MKKFKTMFIINQCIYWSVYLIKTFIIWEWKNPFQWIIDVPTYDEMTRFMLIFYILFFIGVEICVAKNGMDENGRWKPSNQ